jgi:heme-degrading monooxygenase HmoA
MTVLVTLRFRLADAADIEEFEGDLRAMEALAGTQPGYRWSEMRRSVDDALVYLVVSEWDDIEQVRAWEREDRHAVQLEWMSRLAEPLEHRRFTPWQRPAES